MIDKKVNELIKKEAKRQREGIELIPSENFASADVRAPLSSVFVNKYSEGYPDKRYYGGNEFVDELEKLTQERAKKLFNVPYANVQPYSGSPANLAVYLATCSPGDVVVGQALTAGGHLTHGHKVSATGIFYKTVQYGVKRNKKKDLFDYDEIEEIVKKNKPKLIWVGATAYPLIINYKKFAAIADKYGAYLAADIAHVAGLVVGGAHPSPVNHVHIVTTTTHKTLRGPRGAIIMVTKKGLKKDPELGEKINKAVFPGLQGGPHDNTTAAIAVALQEASTPTFKKYAHQIVKNSKKLAETLLKNKIDLIGGGSENHLILVDLCNILGPGAGIFAEKALDLAGMTMNKNTIPEEPFSPFYPSGLRLGTAAATSRGMKEKEMIFIGKTIAKVLNMLTKYKMPEEKEKRQEYISIFKKEIAKNKELQKIQKEVKKVASKFKLP